MPLPRWDLVRVRDYHSMMIQTTAGCPFRCDFCDIIQFNGGFNRPKAPAAVRRELEAILATGYRGSVFGVDDNFIGTPAATSAILDAIIEFQREHGYPFTFYTQASVNLGTPKLRAPHRQDEAGGLRRRLPRHREPGRGRAPEHEQEAEPQGGRAGDHRRRSRRRASRCTPGSSSAATRTSRAPPDRIVEFVKRTRIFTAMTGMLTPVPHTPLWERLRHEGRLQPAEYSGNNTDDEVQFEPRGFSAVQLREGIHSLAFRLFNPHESYRRALSTLQVVTPQIFAARPLRLAYVRAALVSFWSQGLLHFNRDYFRLIWKAVRLDHEIRRQSRRQARRLARLAHRIRTDADIHIAVARESMDQLLEMAHDYRVRFMPEEKLDQVRAWLAGVRERLGQDLLSATDVRAVYEQAARYLKAQTRRHRFPGATLAAAVESALKGLHYEKVMKVIVDGGLVPIELQRPPLKPRSTTLP